MLYPNNKSLGAVAGLLVALLIPLTAQAATLNNIEFSSLPGDQVEIRLDFDSKPPEPKGYTIEKPARIALDLVGASSDLESKYHNLGLGNARSLTVIGVKDRTRVVINLTELVSYSTRTEGNTLLVTVGRNAEQQISAARPSTENVNLGGMTSSDAPVIRAAAANTRVSSLQEIDFRRGSEGEGQVIIGLTDSNASVDMREEGGKIVVEFIDVELPDELRRRLDVADFATPVITIDAVTEEGNAMLVIDPEGDYEYLAYQADNTFTISVKPISSADLERQKKDQFLYTGEKLSLNFQDIEVRAVLQLIADFTSLNLVASDTVGGRITLRLQNVPWDQALDLILKTKGLDKRKVGNVMLVAPADEIAAREKLELETTRQVEELAPVRTEYIQVNYAKAADIAALMSGGDDNESGLLSERGSVAVDERTNTLIVNDTASRLENMRILLATLDVPVQQVLIEARIVRATSDLQEAIGVKWGNVNYNVRGGGLFRDADGAITDTREFDFTAGGSSQTLFDINERDEEGRIEVSRPDNLVVDLGVDVANATSFAIGYSPRNAGFIELELSALEADGRGEVIATPKILTADQQTARIASGQEIPFQEASSSGATTISFKEATLSLEVTPHITPDGRIIMDLDIHQDSVEELAEGGGVPSINTNQIQTQVLVNDGETVVLGGIFQENSAESVIKTPFFGDLPLIGRLFKRTSSNNSKLELLVFITPKLVKDVLATQ